MKRLTLALVATLSGLVQADDFERQHDSHVHGVAQLNLVLDGPVLELQLSSPAANLVGFEHKAAEAKERQRVQQAVATLERGYDMLRLPDAAACLLDEAEVTQTLLDSDAPAHDHDHDEHDHDHDEHDHGDHDHDGDHDDHGDHHDEEGHHDHEEDAGHAHSEHGDEASGHAPSHEDEAGHADFEVRYRFRCGSPAELDGIEVELFRHFPGLDSLEVRMITPSGQQGLTLDASHREITF